MAKHAPEPLRVPAEFWSRAETQTALQGRDIGALFHLLKRYVGASQTKIGTAVGLEQGYVSKVMAGRRTITAIDLLERIADGCSMPDESRMLLGLSPSRGSRWVAAAPHDARSRNRDRVTFASAYGCAKSTDRPAPPGLSRQTDIIESQIPQLRRALDAHDLPPDGPTRQLRELHQVVAAVVSKRLHSNYIALAVELPPLMSELTRSRLQCKPKERRTVARLLVQTYRAADAIADKYGYYDLSARFIERLQSAAAESQDELLMATASYVRTEIFFANGDLETGRRMLERAVAGLAPHTSSRAAATYGSLHMRAAVTAAGAGDAVQARDHLAEADRWARHTAEGVYFGTAFGPASVKIHRLSLAVELGDVGSALRIAQGWAPPRGIPAERRSHYYIDLARAHLQAGQTDRVLDSLATARTIAPEHIQSHPQAHTMLQHLSRAASANPRLAELGCFMGLPELMV